MSAVNLGPSGASTDGWIIEPTGVFSIFRTKDLPKDYVSEGENPAIVKQLIDHMHRMPKSYSVSKVSCDDAKVLPILPKQCQSIRYSRN